MELEGFTSRGTVPYLLALAERLRAADDHTLEDLAAVLLRDRDAVRSARTGRCWHEIAALLDTVLQTVESERAERGAAT